MTKLMGIVNVTPDSFSDGGNAFATEDALAAIEKLIADGADIIDIGAESTRPDATPLSQEEEWERLDGLFLLLPKFAGKVVFSLDTRHAKTAKKAVSYGMPIINDVSGFSDPEMVKAVRNSSCKLVVMHSLSVPADKSIVLPENVDVVAEVLAWGRERIAALEAAGIARERIIFDPGIGFGKTAPQSLALVNGIERFAELGVPLLVGHSRKSFLAGIAPDRDEATLAVSGYLALKKVDILRVHDVAAHRALVIPTET
ncbi:MAG: dihydropteroate synthase [Alphaproteobacteria bacterium]|nr:dihydropteroate synthase [Alphaproteobacteria bacterium]